MGTKAQLPTNMAKALSPTIILLFVADNGPAAPAAKVAEPKMAAAPHTHPKAHQRWLTCASCNREGACWRWHRRSRRGHLRNRLRLREILVTVVTCN